MNYIPRAIEPTLLAFSHAFPVLLLAGARQVGKTTVLEHLAKEQGENRRIVSLDDFKARKLAKHDPELFFSAINRLF